VRRFCATLYVVNSKVEILFAIMIRSEICHAGFFIATGGTDCSATVGVSRERRKLEDEKVVSHKIKCNKYQYIFEDCVQDVGHNKRQAVYNQARQPRRVQCTVEHSICAKE